MNSILDRLRRLFVGQPHEPAVEEIADEVSDGQPAAVEPQFVLDDQSLTRLVRLIAQTREGEYACEETLDLMDEYVELVSRNQDAAALMPLVKGHLDHCVDCTERYEALVRILEDS